MTGYSATLVPRYICCANDKRAFSVESQRCSGVSVVGQQQNKTVCFHIYLNFGWVYTTGFNPSWLPVSNLY